MTTDSRFFKVAHDLAGADGYVSDKGEYVTLTVTEKFLYSYIKSRWEYFVKEKKGEYFDTQESIGDALRIDRRTVLQKMKLLMKHGVVKGEKVKFSNYMNWKYNYISDLKLWKEVDGKKELIVPVKYEKKSKESSKPPKQNVVIPMLGEDFDDLPF